MKVSIKWLSSLVDISGLSPEEIADKLTFAGVEVESIDYLAHAQGIVIGETLDVKAMPDSDHLHICQVNLGNKYGVHQIVCGAPNVAIHQKVIVARDGAVLPGGEIKKGMLRGYESDGMLCSLSELGVDKKQLSAKQLEGIEILPSDAQIGNEDVLSYLGLDDAILDLKVLANRSDLMSLNNVAREISTIFNRQENIETAEIKTIIPNDMDIAIESNFCKQFSIRVIHDIKVKDSPIWMQHYLRSMGIRSINNIVDIGNYIMLLTGQPIHMYDLDKLPKHQLIVKSDFQGEFIALDEKKYNLLKDDIVITSNNKIMCLGGVMGALECAVDEHSKNIAIEAANFDFSNVRRTSSRLGLVSESSQRFAKGINPNQYDYVLNLTAKYVALLCNTDKISPIISVNHAPYKPLAIQTSYQKINDRLGTTFSPQEIKDVLIRDHMQVEEEGGLLLVTAPSYRIDMSCDADVSEEVIRLLGYDNVKSQLPILSQSVGHMDYDVKKRRQIRDYLKGCGLDEILTYSLVRKEDIISFAYLNDDKPYHIINPMTDEHEYLRTNLLDSLLKVANYNVSRQINNLHYFEVSDIDSLSKQETHLGIVLLGNDLYQGHLKQIPYSFFSMKGYFEGIMHQLNIEPNRYSYVKIEKNNDEFHPGKSCAIKIGKDVVGVFGEVHPNVLKKYDLGNAKVIVLEISLDKLFALRSGTKKFIVPNKFPSISRDLALVVDKDIASKDIIDAIKKVDRTIIKEVNIFDEYIGEHLPEGKKSLAINITFESDKETLREEVIVAAQDKILAELNALFKATLRE